MPPSTPSTTSERDRDIFSAMDQPGVRRPGARTATAADGPRIIRKIGAGESECSTGPGSGCATSDLGWRPLERATGIEPAPSVWKTEALPLSYARDRPRVGARRQPTQCRRVPRTPMAVVVVEPRARPGTLATALLLGGAVRPNGVDDAADRAGRWAPSVSPMAGHAIGYGPGQLCADADGIDCFPPRGVAQLGSALALGARGRGFKSRHPDCRSRPG